MSDFDTATAVEPAGDGCYRVTVDPLWSVAGRVNGGYLLATAARAAMAALGSSDGGQDVPLVPVAVTGAFAAAAASGPGVVRTEVLRRGRSTAVVRARLETEGRACLEAVVTAGTLDGAEPVVPGPERPALPAPADCVRMPTRGPGFETPIMGLLDQRLDGATLGWAMGSPSGLGELRGWTGFADGRAPDPLALLLFCDSFPPATFDLPGLVMGWVPTLQLSVFVRAVPAAGPLAVRHVARSVGGGAVDETTDVWDSTGRLVAVGHQLALVRTA